MRSIDMIAPWRAAGACDGTVPASCRVGVITRCPGWRRVREHRRGRLVRTLTVVIGLGLWGSLTPLTAAAQELPGKALFEGKGGCFACHGPDAKGTPVGPDLTDAEWLHFDERPGVEAIVERVKAGVAEPKRFVAPMPPRGGSALTDEEVEAVARYVLSLSEEPPGVRGPGQQIAGGSGR